MSKELEMARSNMLYEVVSGSHAYGTSRPDSDLDIRGIFYPKLEYFFGLKNIEMVEVPGEDTTYYTLAKFFRLASQLNPNIVELLFVEPDCIRVMSPLFEKVLSARDLFLSQKALHSYTGYAFAQIKRLKAHQRWLDNPPSHPTREVFGAEETNGEFVFFNRHSEEKYKAALQEYKNYVDWRTNRNEDRAKLEEKYGLDTKFAYHIYRLLEQGKEILERGTLHTRLSGDTLATCLDIMHGKWSYEQVLAYAEQTEKDMRALVDSGKCAVPYSCDVEKLDKILVEVHQDCLL